MRPLRFNSLALLALPLILAACTAESATDESTAPDGAADGRSFEIVEPSKFAPGGPVSDAELANYHVALTCAVDGEEVGTMTIDLWTEAAPITTRNFLRLADVGFYDGLTFHRILRTFMVQGGDPTGTGMGNSPYGTIEGEFSDAPERAHGYGVLSMARMGMDPNSASCQFFICCDETPNVWSLDGKYASFARVSSGVATLEALATVPTTFRNGENSHPTKKAAIVRAEVREGAAPTGETIARPAVPLDLNGEPEKVIIQHVLVSFAGTPTQATRSKEEAAGLAQSLLERARAGEDLGSMAREHSDDPVSDDDPTPGVYRLLNTGVRDMASERAVFALNQEIQAAMMELQEQRGSGTLTPEDFAARRLELQTEFRAKLSEVGWTPRDGVVRAFGDVGFALEVGEIGMSEYDATASPFGWHIIRRLE